MMRFAELLLLDRHGLLFQLNSGLCKNKKKKKNNADYFNLIFFYLL